MAGKAEVNQSLLLGSLNMQSALARVAVLQSSDWWYSYRTAAGPATTPPASGPENRCGSAATIDIGAQIRQAGRDSIDVSPHGELDELPWVFARYAGQWRSFSPWPADRIRAQPAPQWQPLPTFNLSGTLNALNANGFVLTTEAGFTWLLQADATPKSN